jgi:hypothetical protein
MAGFCESASSLRAPKPAAVGAKSPIVSGTFLKYSRFRETGAGDRVRSALRGRSGSACCRGLRLSARNRLGLYPHTFADDARFHFYFLIPSIAWRGRWRARGPRGTGQRPDRSGAPADSPSPARVIRAAALVASLARTACDLSSCRTPPIQ